MVKTDRAPMVPPLLVDHEAFQVEGYAIIVDHNHKVVATCDDFDDTVNLVAAVNGGTEDEVENSIRVRGKYLKNLRRGQESGYLYDKNVNRAMRRERRSLRLRSISGGGKRHA